MAWRVPRGVWPVKAGLRRGGAGMQMSPTGGQLRALPAPRPAGGPRAEPASQASGRGPERRVGGSAARRSAAERTTGARLEERVGGAPRLRASRQRRAGLRACRRANPAPSSPDPADQAGQKRQAGAALQSRARPGECALGAPAQGRPQPTRGEAAPGAPEAPHGPGAGPGPRLLARESVRSPRGEPRGPAVPTRPRAMVPGGR